MKEDIVTATIRKGTNAPINVKVSTFKDKPGLHIREDYTDLNGDLKPTKKGVFLRNQKEIQTVIDGLTTALPHFPAE